MKVNKPEPLKKDCYDILFQNIFLIIDSYKFASKKRTLLIQDEVNKLKQKHRSAVEWLREQYINGSFSRNDVMKLIDEAFPDIMNQAENK